MDYFRLLRPDLRVTGAMRVRVEVGRARRNRAVPRA